MNTPKKIDLHLHSTVSDGSDTPAELLQNVRAAGIELFALTDHDAVKGCETMLGLLRPGDPGFLTGAEFSCRDSGGKYHILGYGYDPAASSVQALVELGHSIRMKKVHGRLELLRDRLGIDFPEEELAALLAMDNPGKPHIGNLMVKYGYAESKELAIKNVINKVQFPSEYLRPEQAIEAILAGGGIPVLAHPAYGDGDQLILGEEMEQRLRKLMDFGLQGLEAYYSGFTARIRGDMLALAERYDLYVTAGSDYHGRNKIVVLGDTGLEDANDGPEGMRRFLERVSIH